MAKKRTSSGKARLKPYQVFISHATAEKWIAIQICNLIEHAGPTTFRDDRDIRGGDDIPDELRRHLKRSKEVLVLLTPESLNREWITLEIGAAWVLSERMRITVVRYHVPVDSIPSILKSRKSIHLNEFDHYLDELTSRFRGCHGKTERAL